MEARPGRERRWWFVDASTVLASAEDRVIGEAVATLTQCDQRCQSSVPDERRRDVRQLFRLVLRCVRAGRAEAIIRPSEQIAAHCWQIDGVHPPVVVSIGCLPGRSLSVDAGC
jgi:hypothetical protein